MKKEKKSAGKRNGNMIFRIMKVALIAVAFTVALILLYAWLLQRQIVNQDSIPIVNSALKVIGAVIAALCAVIPQDRRRWVSGMTAGLAYILLSFAVFSVLTDKFAFGAGLFSDLLMGGLAGMVTGMLVQLCK